MKKRRKAKLKKPAKIRTTANPPSAKAAGWDSALPVSLKRQLKLLANKVIHVRWMQGGIWLVIAACSLAILQWGADWMFDFSRVVRAMLLAGDLFVFVAFAWWFGVRPWLARLTPEQAALRAEHRWPGLKTSIISAVQLSRQPDGSSILVGSLVNSVEKRMKDMDFRAAIETGHLRRPALAAAAGVILVCAAVWFAWPKSWIVIQRSGLVDLPLPTQTIVIPLSGDFSVQPGTTVELSARAEGFLPKAGRVEIAYPGQRPLVLPLSPKAASPELFSFTLQNVQQPFTYRIYLNDGRTPEFSLKIIRGPILDSVAFEQKYPAYTGLANTQHSAGNLNVLAGSKLLVSGHSDQQLRSARIQGKPGQAGIPLALAQDKKTIAGEISILPEGLQTFTIVLTNSDGIESQNNTVYHAQLTPDKPPEITFATNPGVQTLVKSARPRLRFEVRDDFQIKEVALCCKTDSEPDKTYRLPLDVSKAGGALSFDFLLSDQKAALPWKEGTTLSWWIEAADNNDVTGPGVGRSPEGQWVIVSLEAKRKELQDKISKSAETMEDLSKTNEELRKGVSEIMKAPSGN